MKTLNHGRKEGVIIVFSRVVNDSIRQGNIITAKAWPSQGKAHFKSWFLRSLPSVSFRRGPTGELLWREFQTG